MSQRQTFRTKEMKKLLFLLLITILLSCEKEHCKTCTAIYYTNSVQKGVVLDSWIECKPIEFETKIYEIYPIPYPITVVTCK